MAEFNMEAALPQRSRTMLDYAIPEVADTPSSEHGHRDRDVELALSPIRRSNPTDHAEDDQYGAWVASSLSLASTDFPRPGTPEDTSVEVRHERPQPSPTLAARLKEELRGKRRASRLANQLSPSNKSPRRNQDERASDEAVPSAGGGDVASATSSSNNSRSGGTSPLPELLLPPPERPIMDSRRSSPVEGMDMRERAEILSALTRIAAGGGAGSSSSSSTPVEPLQVSVAITTELQIEQKKQRQRRADLVDDFNGKHYQRRGRSHSSSGGL
jgi:hypothetical protein